LPVLTKILIPSIGLSEYRHQGTLDLVSSGIKGGKTGQNQRNRFPCPCPVFRYTFRRRRFLKARRAPNHQSTIHLKLIWSRLLSPFLLQNENIHTSVPGFTNFDQLETDLSVMDDLTLTPEEEKYLELGRLNYKDSLFCQGCGSCLEQCESAPDIPALMRCCMYVYGYRDLAAAVRNLESISDNTIACAGCSSCMVKCPSGFNIKERVLDIIRLRDFPPEFFL